jgi:PleD family two-component response regulator
VRYGGDELLCAMPNLDAREARARFEKIVTALAAAEAHHSVTFGVAEAEPANSLQELIARADAELLEARHSRTNHDTHARTTTDPLPATNPSLDAIGSG